MAATRRPRRGERPRLCPQYWNIRYLTVLGVTIAHAPAISARDITLPTNLSTPRLSALVTAVGRIDSGRPLYNSRDDFQLWKIICDAERIFMYNFAFPHHNTFWVESILAYIGAKVLRECPSRTGDYLDPASVVHIER